MIWISASSGNPARHGVLLTKEDGTAMTLKGGDHVSFENDVMGCIVGFRFSGRVGGVAGDPTSIMYKTLDGEKGECFLHLHDLITHTGHGNAHTGLHAIQCRQDIPSSQETPLRTERYP